MLAWHLLAKQKNYAFARPGLMRRKVRSLELRTGAPRRKPDPTTPDPVWKTGERDRLERQVAEHAEAAYQRMTRDWQATGPKRGVGATPGRASVRPSTRHAARQT